MNELSFENTAVAFSHKDDAELKKSYLIFKAMNYPWLVKVGTFFMKSAIKLHFPVKPFIKWNVFQQFCGGESIKDCEDTINMLKSRGVGTILDYSVEGEKSEKGFEATTREILKTIDRSAGSEEIPFSVFKVTGIGSFDLLAKIQAGGKLSAKEEESYKKFRERFHRICKYAYDNNVRILIDAEETWIQDVIDELAYEMMALFNKEKVVVYNTYQMYCRASLKNLKDAYHDATMHQYWLGAKLVRGAYMEKERERAEEKGYPDPIQPSKEATDQDFNKALKFCTDNKQRIAVICGSHNAYSNALLTELMDKHSVKHDDERFYFAQLYGMSDHISFNLAERGFNVVKYVPYGPVQSVMPYLVRRAEENTSIAGQSSREYMLVSTEMKRRNNQ
ncbi:proline dehydrogenase family protein [Mangrovivirga sp. M17]|uniref:Proline dehydrogenase family protein n=1 Tax=Mangrovivirga halotolerans TaxID=2993936 RepID=A0ABT3RV24_9BACT|nr:proline dehydrogenase family protein [Mangrovivirga halotolerans]MCX2745000.1 proline dehydrogenase family protein [Mangrovivirga halotolerans]